VGHGQYPALESAPASLSRKIITGLLREKLGFRGTVLTDDLEMKAIRRVGDATKRAIAAGADGVLVCHDPVKILEAHAALAVFCGSGL
jgi:beta-N-acetylhexosaminidase